MNIRNQVQLVGRLGANPQIKILENGTKLARFAIAINNTFSNKKGEKVTSTQWHNVIAWGNLANIAELILQKGTHVTIDGKLINRSFSDKLGNKRFSTEIMVSELLVLNKISKAA
jgi:single-strand DNA-binding protein